MTSKKKVYRRFFVVYASFFVCMLLMLVPIYQLSLNEVEQRTMKTTGAVLSSGLETIEDAMHAASVAAANLYSDQQIFLLAQLSAPISASDGYRILQGTSFYNSVTSVLPLISDSGLYFRNGSMILSNRFFLYANDAYGSFLNAFHSKDIFSWIQRLALLGNTYSHVSMTVSTTAGVRDVVVFSLPLPLLAPSARSTLAALGAVTFVVSDMTLCHNLLLKRPGSCHFVSLGIYYMAQLLLALSAFPPS